LAATTAFARMEDDRHYFSDVVAGAAVGTAVGYLVTRHSDRSAHRLAFAPGPERVGLAITF
jgi:membrane-associated phospholipid phosphatase